MSEVWRDVVDFLQRYPYRECGFRRSGIRASISSSSAGSNGRRTGPWCSTS